MRDEALLILSTFIEKTSMDNLTEDGIIIFLKWFLALKVKWFIEKLFVTFLFAFTMATCALNGFGYDLTIGMRLILCIGIIFSFSTYYKLSSYKKSYDSTKILMLLSKKYPQHYIYKEESQDG